MSRPRGRPKESDSVRVMPEFREEPDVEKLGRALIAVAKMIAEQKQNEAAMPTEGKPMIINEQEAI